MGITGEKKTYKPVTASDEKKKNRHPPLTPQAIEGLDNLISGFG